MRRIASAGVLLVAMTLSFMAIPRSEPEPISVAPASGGAQPSVAAVLAADVVVAPNANVRETATAPTPDEPAAAATSPTVDEGVAVAAETTTVSVVAVEVIAAPVVAARHRPRPPTTTTQASPTTTTTLDRDVTRTTAAPVTTPAAADRPKPAGDRYVTMLVGEGRELWRADYFRNLPYAPGTGWTDGDRAGYRCMYGFLLQDNRVVGRVTFMRVDAAAGYAMINDKYMDEGVRYYDGSIAAADAPKELGDCPRVSHDYTSFDGPTQLPTVTYGTTGGSLLEVRNYKTLVAGDGVTFQQTESTDQRVTVVGYANGLPAIVVYYESMVPGVVMSSDLR